jgi:ABC-type antimicrobial peptide transport system permease subunit
VVLIALPKRDTGTATNVTVRGLGDEGPALRPQVRIVTGRMFRRGSTEIVVGKSIAERFDRTGIGQSLRFGGREWTVVGVFDGSGSGFDSEIWGDGEQMMQSFRRNAFSSVVARLVDPAQFDQVKQRLESDPRLTLDVKRERRFYEEQSEVLSNFIRILGITLSVIFSIGAMIGATITMYAAVANRTAEIGALRALGFRRGSILVAFLAEAFALALLGWAVGLALASLMQLVNISTMNWQSFAELAFSFRLTPEIVWQSFLFAAVMGLVGGVAPALRAARLKIVDALRAA